jgi:hypothetical protein
LHPFPGSVGVVLNRDHPEGGKLAERLRRFADHVGEQSPLYQTLARAAAEDDAAVAILADAPYSQPPANLLFAAVQYLLLEGAGPRLASHYPAVAGPGAEPEGDPVAAFHEFLVEHRDRITALVASRRVQTNEVRRCTALLPAFTAARDPTLPLALIEVGASAGLNLLFDRYHYDYGAVESGPARSPLTLTCEIRSGDPPIPVPVPEVVARVGLDLHPIDVADPDAVRWARSLIWPEQLDRVERFETAVAIARGSPPTLVQGEALELLPRAIESSPVEASLVVYHSFVLNQWTAEDRGRLDDLLTRAANQRPIDRISVEMLEPGAEYADITHTRYQGGKSEPRRLGTAHYHGVWLQWEA